MLEEFVLECLIARIVTGAFEQSGILSIIFSDGFHLLVVVGACQSGEAIWMQFTTTRIQLRAVVFRKLGSERVDRDDNSTTIGLKL